MKVILAGAAGALGAAVIETLAEGGAKVACIARGVPGDQDARTSWFPCADLAREDAVAAAVAAAHGWLGGLDAAINVAGAFAWMRVEDSRPEDWRDLYEANVTTTLSLVRTCLPLLEGGGAIVAVGAASAQPAAAGMGPYGAAKSALGRLVEALAEEVQPRGIRVNAVLPSIIDTPSNRADMPDADTSRWTTPAAIAEVIRFLITPAARAISGALIPVTAGQGRADCDSFGA